MLNFISRGGGRIINTKYDFFSRRSGGKDKAVIVVGSTGSGKSHLSIDLATHFSAEVINADKMQAYHGFDISTNKVTAEECRGVPHHLLGFVHPDADFTSTDFCHHANLALDSIVARGSLPIIAGGSNSYIEALVDHGNFRSRFEFCFLWVHVAPPVLYSFLSDRVDRMLEAGLVEEVKKLFHPGADYSRGIRRAIGVPELDKYFHAEGIADKSARAKLLQESVEEIKENNAKLAARQLQKIHRLNGKWKGRMHRVDATEVFVRGSGGVAADEAWEELVLRPSKAILTRFLSGENLRVSPSEEQRLAAILPRMPIFAASSLR